MLSRQTEMYLSYKRKIKELEEELKKTSEEKKKEIQELIDKYEELLECFKYSGYVDKSVS